MLCVIPARGGSKRVPGKNTRLVGGKPMLVWTIEAARGAGLVPIVSTDCQHIASIAQIAGAMVHNRPAHLAQDNSSTESVLRDVAKACFLVSPEWVITLPPTSPLRTAANIRSVMQYQKDESISCAMTITECKDDLWQPTGDRITRLFPHAPRRQQDRDSLFIENSAVYMTRWDELLMTGSILGSKGVVGIAINREEGWDVNDETDIRIVDMLLRGRVGT